MANGDSTAAVVKAEPAPTAETSVWVRIAERHGMAPKGCREVILNTLMPKRDGKLIATEADMAAALLIADRYKLDPFAREIFFTPGKGGGILSIVGIDGWVTLANRERDYDGWTGNEILDANGNLEAFEVSVHFKTRTHPVVVRERLKECKRNTDPWRDMPFRMLRNRALCQAIRTAFGVGGIMLDDEAEAMFDAPRQAPRVQMASQTDLRSRLAERAAEIAPAEVVSLSPDQFTAEQNAELDRQIAASEGA